MQKIIENWEIIVAIIISVLELILRLVPTDKDYSVLNGILRFLNYILPSRATGSRITKDAVGGVERHVI